MTNYKEEDGVFFVKNTTKFNKKGQLVSSSS